jgi:hypothetical protein
VSTVTVFDQQRAESFGVQLLSALNHGALCLMISVGHRTGLFDAMRDYPPATSEDIALRAGLNERYVRECLGALLTSGVVEFEPSTRHFYLPSEHAGYLTRAAGADNIVAVPVERRELSCRPIKVCAECFSQEVRELNVREEIVRMAERTGSRVEVVNHSDSLMRLGGVGCLLRFLGPEKYGAVAA